MSTHIVLIDFENTRPKDMGSLPAGSFEFKVFLGTHQGRIPVDMARAFQAFGPDLEYIQIEGKGSNALDFHIAYYLGQLAAEQPRAFFHVISKDTGFDPLIKHLNRKGIHCRRCTSIADIPLAEETTTKTDDEMVGMIVDNLLKRKTARPRKLKTLASTIQTLFANQLPEKEIARLIAQLSGRGIISVVDDKVSYELPG